jgi:orotidine-5'-phosphate decarboxylase
MNGIVISLDVESPEALKRVLDKTSHLPQVSGFKLGALCSLTLGLAEAVRLVRSYTDKQVIYDHQKAGNDIPDITKRLVRLAAESGVAGFIMFPFAGPEVLRAGVEEGHACDLTMIVGAYMTHPFFIEEDGGFVPALLPQKVFDCALGLGVKDFVLPGNRPALAASYARYIEAKVESPAFWTPGIGRQGGSIASLARALSSGARLVPIVGSSIYEAQDPVAEIGLMLEGV